MTRKTYIKIGSLVSLAAPAAAVISCGYNTPSQEDIKAVNTLKSSKAKMMFEEDWQKEVIKKDGYKDVITKADFDNGTEILVLAFNQIILEGVESNNKYIEELRGRLEGLDEYTNKVIELGKTSSIKITSSALALTWNLDQYIDDDKTYVPLTSGAKEFILKHDKRLRAETFKRAVSLTLLMKNQITKDKYKKLYLKEDQELSNIDKITDSNDFYFTKQGIDQKLFAKWHLESESSNLISVTLPTPLAAETDADKQMDSTQPAGNLYDESEDDKKTRKYTKSSSNIGGFQGVASLPAQSKGALKFDIDGLKKVQNYSDWNGYLQEGELVTSDINLFSKDISKKADLTKINGYMPVYVNKELKFAKDKGNKNIDYNYIKLLLSKNTDIYDDAIKFYTKEKNIYIEIKTQWYKDWLIDEGLEFIK